MSILVVSLLALPLMERAAYAQGPLFPTNGPGPGMKTLDQVEARIPISSIPATISSAGSYYLTGPLATTSSAHGIQISAHNVTLDLNGYSLTGSTNALSGVYVSGIRSNIVVRNGTLTGWGQHGINMTSVDNGMVAHVRISGVAGQGILLGLNNIALDCQVLGAYYGIRGYNGCTIRRSQIMDIRAVGIDVMDAAMIEDVQVYNGGTNGIRVNNDSMVRNCLVISNRASGITVGHRCAVLDNQVNMGALDGISALITCRGDDNRVEGNQLHETGRYAISARGRNNVIADNAVLNDNINPNYDFSQSNSVNILIHRIPAFLNWPCTAKLAGSAQGNRGIIIGTNNITVDLGGHTLRGVSSVGSGIEGSGFENITVRNGTIRDWIDRGIDLDNSRYCALENIKLINNYQGAIMGYGARVDHCGFFGHTASGLACDNGAVITECRAEDNGHYAIAISEGGVISRCAVHGNHGHGISAFTGSSIFDCSVSGNASNGIYAAQSRVHNNICADNGGDGIVLGGLGSDVRNNQLYDNHGVGIRATLHANLIIQNSAKFNWVMDYSLAAGNATGILVNVTGGGAITSVNPWVNFSY